ncbi:MAG: Fe-S cluster assembly ATPase SufC [Ezakiella sp.]|nr:Fe-S cluster assembly ATPase SufC [Ezakiella sp.]
MLLKLNNIHASIDDKEILKDISLEVGPGEVHVVMGPNGSGKSTLANVIMNTGGYTVNSGNIIFKDEDITTLPADKRARMGMFMSYQNPVGIPGVTMEAFIRASMQARDKDIGFFELRDKMDELMEELHMDSSYKERFVNVGFSGGEKKKSEILQLLMMEPELGILDETDSGLDVDAIDVVGRGIEKFRERDDSSLIVITHHHEILRHVHSDFVHVIMDGKLVKTGTAELMKRIDDEGFGFLRNELEQNG